MAYKNFERIAGRAIPLSDGLYLQKLKAVFDTDASGQVAFNPNLYAGNIFEVKPGLAKDLGHAYQTLTISGVVIDGETITIGSTVISWEFDTDGIVTGGKYQINIAPYAVKAEGTLTFSGDAVESQTVTVGGKVFEFDTDMSVTGTNIPVYLGTDTDCTNAILQLVKAINNTSGCTVTAEYATATTMKVYAKKAGTVGNSIASTETCTNAGWGGGTLSGGVDCSNLHAGEAFLAAVNRDIGTHYLAEFGATHNIVIITTKTPGAAYNVTGTTETMANGGWGDTTLKNGTDTCAFYACGYDNGKLTCLQLTDGLAAASKLKVECFIDIIGTK